MDRAQIAYQKENMGRRCATPTYIIPWYFSDRASWIDYIL